MKNSGKEALAKRLRIAKKIEDCDGVRDCCTCEEILDGKEIEYSEVAKIGKLVEDNREKIKAGESDEEFLRRGLAKVSRIEKQSRIAKKKNIAVSTIRPSWSNIFCLILPANPLGDQESSISAH